MKIFHFNILLPKISYYFKHYQIKGFKMRIKLPHIPYIANKMMLDIANSSL